jgi:hypothetical protein
MRCIYCGLKRNPVAKPGHCPRSKIRDNKIGNNPILGWEFRLDGLRHHPIVIPARPYSQRKQ